jgi:capsular polysaccharide transport system permease protein
MTLPTWIARNRWFVILVILPTALAAVYYALIASDIFVSESRFVIKSEAQKPAATTTLANLVQTTGLSAGQEQTNEIIDYISSRTALDDLAKRLDIFAVYSGRGADALSRFPAPFRERTFENLFRYYTDRVSARLDPTTGVAVLKVQAFTPADAVAINRQLLALSEGLVNRLNVKARANAIAENERQVTIAEARVRNARLALAAYRNQSNLLDPGKQATSVFDVTTRLVSEQAALKAQLDLMRRVAPANPTIPSLEARIAAMSTQIAAQNGRAVGGQGAISTKLSGYESLALEQEFSAQALTAAQTQLTQARADAVRQQFYLERVVEPNTPDMAVLPHRVIALLAIFGVLACLYFVGWMLVVGILEHAPED